LKILFALNQNDDTTIEEMLLSEYKSIIGADFQYSKEYDLSGVNKRLFLENFDVLVINEELERNNGVTTSFIDDLTDRLPIRIILIIRFDHEVDNYVRRLFNIGVYDLLYSHDITKENIVNLIISPRTKIEAKVYLDLHDVEDVVVESELNYISEDELFNIFMYFEGIEENEYSKAFDHIIKQYNGEQILYLIDKLSDSIKEVLEREENKEYLKYKEIVLSRWKEVKRDNTAESKVSDVLDKPKDDAMAVEESLIEKKVKETLKPFKKLKEEKEPKVITKIETVEKIVTKVEKVNIVPSDYKKTIVLVSPESTGKTEIACNLAVALSNNTDKVVALLDFDLNKYGILYNFKIDPGESGENYYKFRLFYNRIDKYLSGKEDELTRDEVRGLSVYHDKNLLVYTGNQEAKIKDSGIVIGDNPINDVLMYMIGEIRAISDILIIDMGSDMNNSFLSNLINIGNVEKLLITNQNIETLNTLPYKLRLKHGRDYDDWRLIVNNYNPNVSIKEKEIVSFFSDKSIEYLKFNIKSINYIPYSESVLQMKAKRDVGYNKDKDFKDAIDNLIKEVYPINIKKKKKLGFF